MSGNPLLAKGEVVRDLSRAISDERYGLSGTRNLVRVIMRERAWERFIVPETGEVVEYDGPRAFERFVATPPLEGLGSDVDTLRRLCEDDTAALAFLQGLFERGQRQGARTDLVSNRHKVEGQERPAGESRARGFRQLRHADQAGYQEVLPGEKSVHGALVAAGVRRKRVSVYVDDPEDTARTLLRHYGADGLAAVAEACGRLARQGA